MLSRELDEAITILRNVDNTNFIGGNAFNNRLADLLLVCAAQGDVLQAVAESVAKTVVEADKVRVNKIEVRDV